MDLNMKHKILFIMKILLEKSDESHPMTIKDLILELNSLGIVAERKSITTDLRILEEFGIDIILLVIGILN